MHYQGKLYRALNPIYARDPFSGIGAALYGGRFNPKGTPALYLALSPATALLEANQVGSFQPTTLVAYDADLPDILDCGQAAELARFGMDAAILADPSWRDAMKGHAAAPTQQFAMDALAAGYAGLHVPSYARGAQPHDRNIVLLKWTSKSSSKLTLIDDENRLKQL